MGLIREKNRFIFIFMQKTFLKNLHIHKLSV